MSDKDVPAPPTTDKGQQPPRARFRLLATTDLHAHLRPFDYLTGVDATNKGLARLASLIQEQRASHPNCLLLDNGDTYEGTPLAEFAALDPLRGGDDNQGPRINPMLEAMNALEYDAAVLGNHDFNFGLAFVRDIVGAANFPIVLCNIWPTDGAQLWPRSIVLERQIVDQDDTPRQVRIGIVGAAPPQIVEWDSAVLHGALSAVGIEECAVAEARALRSSGKVDLVIALAHSGIDWDAADASREDAVVPLARSRAFDAIVAGHTHETFPSALDNPTGMIEGTCVVQPGAHGSHLGVIDLTLAFPTSGQVEVVERAGGLLAIDSAPPAPAVMRLSEAAHSHAQERLSEDIGRTEVALTTHFSRCAPCPTAQLISCAQIAAAQRLIAGHPSAQIPMVSAAAPSRMGGPKSGSGYTDIPVGPIQIRQSFDLCPYPNRLAIVRVDGAGLKAWLEHAAAAFRTLEPGIADQNLVDERFPGYNFDTVFGVTYRFDVTALSLIDDPNGPGRVRDLCYDGSPIEPDQPLLLVTNSYRMGDGGGFATVARPQVVLSTDLLVRHLLVDFIRSGANQRLKPERPWSLIANVGHMGLAATHQAASRHETFAQALGLSLQGFQSDGQLRIAIPL